MSHSSSRSIYGTFGVESYKLTLQIIVASLTRKQVPITLALGLTQLSLHATIDNDKVLIANTTLGYNDKFSLKRGRAYKPSTTTDEYGHTS